ncbi:MAG: hypothetical protein JKY37_07370 [Nannocystaceae bacterium]|nr:hypothetical protein [Nannocystaceae bacterium]
MPAASGPKVKRWERTGDRVPAFVERWGPTPFYMTLGLMTAGVVGLSLAWLPLSGLAVFVALFGYMGVSDLRQTRHAIMRNFPVLGRLRYFFESVRPELRQYFVESDQEENPYSRMKRSII